MSNSRTIRSPNTTGCSRPTSIDINALLRLHPSNKRLQTRRLKDISTLDFEQRLCFEDLEAKAAALFKRSFRVNLRSGSIEFYQPKELLTLDRVDEWKEQPATRDSNTFVEESLPKDIVRDRLSRLTPARLLKDCLDISTVGRQHIDLVVTGEDEEAETVFELSPNREFGGYDRYEKLLKTPFTPSHHAKSEERQSLQRKEETIIYDSTYVLNPLGTLETAAQPIEIFHPPFAELKRNLQAPEFRPDPAILGKVHSLMDATGMINNTEDIVRDKLAPILASLLRRPVSDLLSRNKCHYDGLVLLMIRGYVIPALTFEFKKTLGEGNCDDLIAQTEYSALSKWQDDNVKYFRERCPCPHLLLAGGGGSYLALLGVVWTDRFIVQRFTDMVYIGYDSVCHDDRIHRTACLITAIRDFMPRLEGYYQDVDEKNIEKLIPHQPHPRYFPQCFKYLCRIRKQLVTIKYVRAITDKDCTNLIYVAKEEVDGREVIVKFSDRYGYEAHQLLAAEDWAPKLYYVGLLDGEHDVLEHPEARGGRRPSSGLYIGPIRMIVMEYLKGTDARNMATEDWPIDAYDQVKKAVEHLHGKGFVFGDLRCPNVVFAPPRLTADSSCSSANSPPNRAWLIDFDWSGKEGELCYPAGLSNNAGWTDGVASFGEIKREHDLAMLEKHFKKKK